MGHHDGTNYTLYRIAKDRDEAERIADKIYNREIDEEGFRRRTRSLYPYVAAVYGWKTKAAKPTRPHKMLSTKYRNASARDGCGILYRMGETQNRLLFIISSIPFITTHGAISAFYRPRSFVYLPSFFFPSPVWFYQMQR